MDIRRAFAILGLSEGASPLQVRAAYRDLVKVWHPDRFAHDPPLQAKAAEQLRQINAAFDLLQQPQAQSQSQPRTAPPPPSPPPPPPPVVEPRPAAVRVSRYGPPYQLLYSMVVLTGAMIVVSIAGAVWSYLTPDLPDLLDPASVMLDASRAAGGGLDRTYVEEPVASDSGAMPTSLGSYATSVPGLANSVEGSWLLNGKRLTFHQGMIRAAGDNAALGFYDPNTPRSLVFRKARTVHHVVVEVLFTPATMRWVLRDSGKRFVYEFVRVS